MKFIQIREGFSVRKSEIEAVSKIEDLKCEIYTVANVYKCDYPYSTLLTMLETENIEENMAQGKTNKLLESIINNQQRNVA